MKICINTAIQRFGGAVQVALSFINECKNFTAHEFVVWVGPGLKKSIDTSIFPENFQFRFFDFGVVSFQKTIEINKALQQQEKLDKPDVIISTSGPSYFHSLAPQILGYNLPLYLYPESPYVSQLFVYKRMRLAVKKKMHHYFFKRDAIAFVAQTEDVNQRVRKQLKTSNVFTVTNTASSLYQGWKKYPALLPPKKEGVFRFVTVSAYYAHKDLEIIPKILEELSAREVDNVEFVLTLNPAEFQTHISAHKNIHNVGPVLPEACPSLYDECDAMFLPTLAECFSASYPEAMIMEKPIVTTDLGFAKSICGEAALYYKAMDPKAAADAVVRLSTDTSLQRDLIARGKEQLKSFDTPRSRAEKYLRICQAAVDNQLDNLEL